MRISDEAAKELKYIADKLNASIHKILNIPPDFLELSHSEKASESGGTRCPACNSGDVEGGFIEIASPEAHQDMYCLQCESTWTDVYQLHCYRNLINETKK